MTTITPSNPTDISSPTPTILKGRLFDMAQKTFENTEIDPNGPFASIHALSETDPETVLELLNQRLTEVGLSGTDLITEQEAGDLVQGAKKLQADLRRSDRSPFSYYEDTNPASGHPIIMKTKTGEVPNLYKYSRYVTGSSKSGVEVGFLTQETFDRWGVKDLERLNHQIVIGLVSASPILLAHMPVLSIHLTRIDNTTRPVIISDLWIYNYSSTKGGLTVSPWRQQEILT